MLPCIDYSVCSRNISNGSHWLIAITTREVLRLAPAKRSPWEVSDRSLGALWTGFLLPSRNKCKQCHCLDTCLLQQDQVISVLRNIILVCPIALFLFNALHFGSYSFKKKKKPHQQENTGSVQLTPVSPCHSHYVESLFKPHDLTHFNGIHIMKRPTSEP